MEKYFIKAAKSPVSRLEKLAPTDASFAEATAISFDVFPVSEEERRSITEMEECIAQAYKDKKYVECEEMQKKVSVAKAAMHERTRVFELVLQCEKDAAACERMEFFACERMEKGCGSPDEGGLRGVLKSSGGAGLRVLQRPLQRPFG
jgi:hypothetical protein